MVLVLDSRSAVSSVSARSLCRDAAGHASRAVNSHFSSTVFCAHNVAYAFCGEI